MFKMFTKEWILSIELLGKYRIGLNRKELCGVWKGFDYLWAIVLGSVAEGVSKRTRVVVNAYYCGLKILYILERCAKTYFT